MSERAMAGARVLACVVGGAAMVLLPLGSSGVRAAAPDGGGDTISCEAGQTANIDLGTCVDPTCGVGTERDPTGQTRYCVAIPCGPGQYLLPYSNTCVVWPPPPPKCPNGSTGVVQRSSTGVTLIICPRPLPHGAASVIAHKPATNAP